MEESEHQTIIDKLMSVRAGYRYELMQYRKNSGNLNKTDLKKIYEYLENPTKTGIWILKASKNNKLKDYLKKEIEETIKNNESIEVSSGKRKLKINLEKRDKDALLKNLDRFTFVFNLFTYIYHIEKEDDSFDTYLEMEDSKDKLLLNLIDLKKLKIEFNDAFDFFKEEIYFKHFDTKVRSGKITKIKEGFFLLPKESENRMSRREEHYVRTFLGEEFTSKIELISLTTAPLEKIRMFFEKAGFINETSIFPVYSPEEEVFSPYFSFLEQAHSKIIDNNNIKRLLIKSISEYNDGNYSHCISTIGLITEEYLVQIYETLFRDICPKRPLGELYDQIHISLKKELQTKGEQTIEFSKYFDEIKKIEQSKNYPSKELISFLRNFINLTKDMHSINQTRIKEIQKPQSNISLFNKQLRDNLSEVIKNRNATSHRSRIPIGNYEALRSVYGCITLILWWTKQKENIDWNKDPKEILKRIIDDNQK